MKMKNVKKAMNQKWAYVIVIAIFGVGLIAIGSSDYFAFSAIPAIDGPNNMVVPAPYEGTISWKVDAENGSGTYRILRDQEPLTDGTWVDGDIVNVVINEVERGTYEYMIVFTDTENYNISHIVMVQVYTPEDLNTVGGEGLGDIDDSMLVIYVLIGGTIIAGVIGAVVGKIQSGRYRG